AMTRSRSASETRSGWDNALDADISEQPALRATSDSVARSSERRRRELMTDSRNGEQRFYNPRASRPKRTGSLWRLCYFSLDGIEQRLAYPVDHALNRRFGLFAHALHLFRADLVDLHALPFDLSQGLTGFGASVFAFEIARFLRGIHDDALFSLG